MKILVLYMPVLHKGYLSLIERVLPDSIGIISEDVLKRLPGGLEYVYKKDIIRAVPSLDMVKVLANLFHDQRVCVVLANENILATLRDEIVVMPEEDISVALAEKYFENGNVTFVTTQKLRYHRNNVEEKKLLVPSRRILLCETDRELMTLADKISERSPDWYRQVGGVLVTKDGIRIVAYNEHQPHEQISATFGDPRSIFKSGIRTDLSHSDHAEHVLIGEAARLKIGTDGSTVYLTTFPCLPCARLMARSGVKRLFYRDASYGLLDADEELRVRGVELIEVSDEN